MAGPSEWKNHHPEDEVSAINNKTISGSLSEAVKGSRAAVQLLSGTGTLGAGGGLSWRQC